MSMNAISARQRYRTSASYEEASTPSIELSKPHGLNSELIRVSNLTTEEIQELKEGTQKSIDLEELRREFKDPTGLGRRASPRFELQLSALVVNHHHSFRTNSLNISASGALLKEKLPKEFMNCSFEVLFMTSRYEDPKNTKLLFSAIAIGGPLRTPRICFRSSSLGSFEKLQKLVAGLTPLPEARG